MSWHQRIDWVAVAALFVSVCALSASILEGRSTREHNKLTVRPIPLVVFHAKGGGKSGVADWPGWRLSNLGPGTALVRDVLLFRKDESNDALFGKSCYAGSSNPLSWVQVLRTLEANPNLELPRVTYQNLGKDFPIKAGDSIPLIEFEPGELAERIVANHKDRIVVRACVCSFYQECFEVGTNSATPVACTDVTKFTVCN